MNSKSLFTFLLSAICLGTAASAQALDPMVIPPSVSLGTAGYLVQTLHDVDSLEVEFFEEQGIHPRNKKIAVEDEIGLYVQRKVVLNGDCAQDEKVNDECPFQVITFEKDIVNFTADPKGNGVFAIQLPAFTDSNYRYVLFFKSETDPVNGGPLYYLRPGSELLLRSPNSTLGARLVGELRKIESSTAFTQDEPAIVWTRFLKVNNADVDFGDGPEAGQDAPSSGTSDGQKPANAAGLVFGESGGWTCSLDPSAVGAVQDVLIPGGFLILTLAQSLRRKPRRD